MKCGMDFYKMLEMNVLEMCYENSVCVGIGKKTSKYSKMWGDNKK